VCGPARTFPARSGAEVWRPVWTPTAAWTAASGTGVLTISFQGGDGATGVLIQPNGDIVAIGFSEDNTTGVTDIALARYLG
jgi:hypothetical protein